MRICEIWIVAVVYDICHSLKIQIASVRRAVRYVYAHTCEFFTPGDDLTYAAPVRHFDQLDGVAFHIFF